MCLGREPRLYWRCASSNYQTCRFEHPDADAALERGRFSHVPRARDDWRCASITESAGDIRRSLEERCCRVVRIAGTVGPRGRCSRFFADAIPYWQPLQALDKCGRRTPLRAGVAGSGCSHTAIRARLSEQIWKDHSKASTWSLERSPSLWSNRILEQQAVCVHHRNAKNNSGRTASTAAWHKVLLLILWIQLAGRGARRSSVTRILAFDPTAGLRAPPYRIYDRRRQFKNRAGEEQILLTDRWRN